MRGRGGVDKVIFKLNQQAEIVLGRVALGVEMGIGNLEITTDHNGSVSVEHDFSPTETGKKLGFLILSCEIEKSRMLCSSLLVNKVDGSLLQQCRGSDVRQLSKMYCIKFKCPSQGIHEHCILSCTFKGKLYHWLSSSSCSARLKHKSHLFRSIRGFHSLALTDKPKSPGDLMSSSRCNCGARG